MESSVLIAIVNWDNRDMLDQCLTSIHNKTDYENYTVLVIDNGSNDGSLEMIKSDHSDVNIIENERNLGFPKAMNQGFEKALDGNYDYLLMMNNDVRVKNSGYLETMVSIMESNRGIGILGCKIVEPNGEIHYDGKHYPLSNGLFPFVGSKYEYNKYQEQYSPSDLDYVDDVVGAVSLIRVDAIRDVGMLDEAFSPGYFEESDYNVRMWNSGYKLGYIKEIEIEHVRHQTSKKIDDTKLTYIQQRNRIRFMLLNYPIKWLIIGIPMMFLLHIELFFERSGKNIHLFKGFKSNPLSAIKYLTLIYVNILSQAPDIYQKRKNRENVWKLLK